MQPPVTTVAVQERSWDEKPAGTEKFLENTFLRPELVLGDAMWNPVEQKKSRNHLSL